MTDSWEEKYIYLHEWLMFGGICIYLSKCTGKTCALPAAPGEGNIQREAKKRGRRKDFGLWGS